MGELSAEAFEDWLPPNEIIDHYIRERDPDPKGRAIAMLCDGLLRAAAAQLIVNGKDLGMALIPPELWEYIQRSDVWTTGRFRLAFKLDGKPWSASGYDVRVDRDIQALPARDLATGDIAPPSSAAKKPLPEKRFKAWLDLFLAANAQPTEDAARASLNALFPDNTVTRERLRDALPSRPKGRPGKSQGAQ